MPKMEHKINYFDFQPSVQSVELINLWSMHPDLFILAEQNQQNGRLFVLQICPILAYLCIIAALG